MRQNRLLITRKTLDQLLLLAGFVTAVFIVSCATPANQQAEVMQPADKNKSQKLAEGVISTGEDYGPAFTVDGNTLYFTRRTEGRKSAAILVSQLEGATWSAPQVAPFSGKYYDVEPFISPDGSRFFFASKRPIEGDTPNKDFDLWVMEKTSNGWGSPKPLTTVNAPGYDNYPSVATNGTLYFGSSRDGSRGIDLYRARLVNGQYETPQNLGDVINSEKSDADPYIAPDESYLIFASSRPGGLGEGDLYISFNRNGNWTAPRSLGELVNSPDWDYTPLISRDGQTFFFSRGWGDIYRIPLSALNLKP